ncbi:hypothetical protein AAFF_G00402550 [Aldrovandia affinis]|uniref:Uncharacterized protein n=1 Tax=Aldrovandia affinis TaxID=143900 RepID=A0AAD7T8A2_9TELE|nr:hypothetical protein AAFF_G00402550 [Aldrovandia affinis]
MIVLNASPNVQGLMPTLTLSVLASTSSTLCPVVYPTRSLTLSVLASAPSPLCSVLDHTTTPTSLYCSIPPPPLLWTLPAPCCPPFPLCWILPPLAWCFRFPTGSLCCRFFLAPWCGSSGRAWRGADGSQRRSGPAERRPRWDRPWLSSGRGGRSLIITTDMMKRKRKATTDRRLQHIFNRSLRAWGRDRAISP